MLELEPRPEVAARAADLAVRETRCCSFFTFDLTATGGGLPLAISTGCDDLVACSHPPSCPLPFTGPG